MNHLRKNQNNWHKEEKKDNSRQMLSSHTGEQDGKLVATSDS